MASATITFKFWNHPMRIELPVADDGANDLMALSRLCRSTAGAFIVGLHVTVKKRIAWVMVPERSEYPTEDFAAQRVAVLDAWHGRPAPLVH